MATGARGRAAERPADGAVQAPRCDPVRSLLMRLLERFPAFSILLIVADAGAGAPCRASRRLADRPHLLLPRGLLHDRGRDPRARPDEPHPGEGRALSAHDPADGLPAAAGRARDAAHAAPAGGLLRGVFRDALEPDDHGRDDLRPALARPSAGASVARARRLGGRADDPDRRLRRPRAAQPRRLRDRPPPAGRATCAGACRSRRRASGSSAACS
jgi:hypothetical protein